MLAGKIVDNSVNAGNGISADFLLKEWLTYLFLVRNDTLSLDL